MFNENTLKQAVEDECKKDMSYLIMSKLLEHVREEKIIWDYIHNPGSVYSEFEATCEDTRIKIIEHREFTEIIVYSNDVGKRLFINSWDEEKEYLYQIFRDFSKSVYEEKVKLCNKLISLIKQQNDKSEEQVIMKDLLNNLNKL